MGIFSAIMDRIKDSIAPEQRNGMEDTMTSIAGGAASASVAVAAEKAISPELAAMAKSVGANVATVSAGDHISTPGDGVGRQAGKTMTVGA